MIADHGGLFPTGLFPLVIVTSGVVFAYAAVELVGTAAGETEEPEKIMPRAINSVIARIALFYVGSVFLLGLLLPYTTYKSGESPFVTFFSRIGLEGAGTVMNIVVLTAAFSSWDLVRGRVQEVARERIGYTGEFPVVANRPLPDDEDD